MGNGSSAPVIFPDQSDELDLGVINGYTLVRRLGKGSYGKVYECVKNGASYAMKIQKYVSAQELDYIVREIEQLTKIDHPNIIKYITTFPWTVAKKHENLEVVCIVTSLVRGGSLEMVLKRLAHSDQMPPPEVRAKWTVQLISTMSYLHVQGKVHRDLKPANILVDSESLDLVIIDFGTARDLDDQGYAYTIVGTPLYMAPELRSVHRQPYTNAVDVWSIGMILIEVLAGLRLDTALMKLTEKAQWEGSLLKKLTTAKVPQVLIEILTGMLRSDPSQRIRLTDLEASSLYRGYRLCYGLVPDDLVDDEILFITASATNFSSLLVAVESQPDQVVKWAISMAKSHINNIPFEVFQNTKVSSVIQSLVQRHPEAKDLLTLIDKRKRRSRVNSTEIPLLNAPPRVKGKGWSISSSAFPRLASNELRSTKKSGFVPLTRASSETLEAISCGPLKDDRYVEGVIVRLSIFEMTASDSVDIGMMLVDLTSSSAPRALSLFSTEQEWHPLLRKGPEPSAHQPGYEKRRWSMLHITEWVELDPDYHPILTAAYHTEGVEGLVLKRKGKTSRIVNLAQSIIRSPRGTPSALRPE